MGRTFIAVILLLGLSLPAQGQNSSKVQYIRIGNAADAHSKTSPGFSLMGGGKDQDAAFQWMCEKSGGGDFLVLRAGGTDAYNSYIGKLCKQNSVATLIIPNREAANDPTGAEAIAHAEAIFISGGDQGNYVNFWQKTPVEEALNAAIRRGVPLGGTSAGLAVLGEYSFSALNDTAYSKDTLQNCFDPHITIEHDFLKIPILATIITDTHFVTRDRQGRLLTFMARIVHDNHLKELHAIAVDEKAVVLLEPDGSARVIGEGKAAYFYRATSQPSVCEPGKPLTFGPVEVFKVTPGGTFPVSTWKPTGIKPYQLDVNGGKVTSTNQDGALY